MISQCDGVLIVEDDSCIRETVKEVLEMEGYRVHTAENGREALELLRNDIAYPVLILLDLMMPVMNGWQFLEARRNSRTFSKLPVVVVSAVAEEARDSGATEILRKPPDLESLLSAVRHHVRPGTGPVPVVA